MSIDEKAFEAFKMAYRIEGGMGLGYPETTDKFKKALEAYEAAKEQPVGLACRDAFEANYTRICIEGGYNPKRELRRYDSGHYQDGFIQWRWEGFEEAWNIRQPVRESSCLDEDALEFVLSKSDLAFPYRASVRGIVAEYETRKSRKP